MQQSTVWECAVKWVNQPVCRRSPESQDSFRSTSLESHQATLQKTLKHTKWVNFGKGFPCSALEDVSVLQPHLPWHWPTGELHWCVQECHSGCPLQDRRCRDGSLWLTLVFSDSLTIPPAKPAFHQNTCPPANRDITGRKETFKTTDFCPSI